MSNDRLRDAMLRNGLTPTAIAERVGVDPKTAERWITQGRAPYPRYRFEIAALVKEDEAYLWPDVMSEARADRIAQSELVQLYPRRAAISMDLWQRLIEHATSRIEILVYVGLFLPEQYPQLMKDLAEKAAGGAKVRIMLGDPDSPEVARRGAEEGIGDAIASKVRNVLTFYAKLRNVPGVAIHLHGTPLYNSIYRFDDEMVVNSHVLGFPAAHAPALHLRRLSGGDLFGIYADSFDRIWSTSTPAFP
jgi:transcriptional regulator with XRE-family HTH domain